MLATLITAVLTAGISAVVDTLVASAVMIDAVLLARTRFTRTASADETPLFVVPRGIVILLAALGAVTFLTEGAVLDWGALLLTGKGLVPTASPRGSATAGPCCEAGCPRSPAMS